MNPTGRDTMGVKFVGVRGKDEVIAIALNPEKPEEEGEGDETEPEATDEMGNAVPATDVIEADASEDGTARPMTTRTRERPTSSCRGNWH